MYFKIVALLFMMTLTIDTFAAGKVFLDGKKLKNREEMQLLLEKELMMPANTSKNFGAVYDVLLADYKTESLVRIKHLEILRKKMGKAYIEDFIEIVGQAAEDNAHVILILE
jgi:RNAse (barnase) inhibitor barstar